MFVYLVELNYLLNNVNKLAMLQAVEDDSTLFVQNISTYITINILYSVNCLIMLFKSCFLFKLFAADITVKMPQHELSVYVI